MKGQKAVVGVFTYLDDTLKAIGYAKSQQKSYQVFSPTYVPALNHAVDESRSPVGGLSLTGAVTGLTAGFALAIWTSLDWPMRVSAKNIVSIPGFVVVGYEWTILFGSLATLLGIFILCRLPNYLRKVGYDPRFSDDKYGVAIACAAGEVEGIQQALRNAGADEVLVKEGI
jgi:hypothetical protein